jgi:hypothetical protein
VRVTCRRGGRTLDGARPRPEGWRGSAR